MAIKNIIFDLGGVILDLNVGLTLDAFAVLSGKPREQVVDLFHSAEGFLAFEKGVMDEQAFRPFVRDLLGIDASDGVIDKCWNAMLLDLPMAKLEWLMTLRSEYRTFLLSNTNTIHLREINEVILPRIANINSLDQYFHKSYYSHLMGMRKPDAEIFEVVLNENGLTAEETLFLDDNALNVEGAAKLGIQVIHVDTNKLDLTAIHTKSKFIHEQ